MDHQRQISDFMSRTTTTDAGLAKKILEEHNWNVDEAVKAYRLYSTALPPVGPRKNLETNLIGAEYNAKGEKNTSPPGTQEYRKIKRGLSKTTENVPLVSKARESVLHDIVESEASTDGHQHFVDTPEYTFILPDLTKFPEDFRAFLHKDLIETATLVSLEQAGRLNWWTKHAGCDRLLPLATTGDGNCLLHAASLGMWGFHDRQLTLRRALYQSLGSDVVTRSFWRRWRWHQTQVNRQSGLILSEAEWKTEWNNMLKLASTTPRSHPGSRKSCCDSPATKGLMERSEKDGPTQDSDVFYESLEEFHVFVLAHVLRRPIVVVSDTVLKNCEGEALAPIPFGGIYLPLEVNPSDCHDSPLLLTYDAAHFSALVPMEQEDSLIPHRGSESAAIPLVDPDQRLLPIHFLVDPGPQFTWNKDENDLENVSILELSTEEKLRRIQDYLRIINIPILDRSSRDGEGSSSARPRSNSWSGPKAPLVRSQSVESSESSNSGYTNPAGTGPAPAGSDGVIKGVKDSKDKKKDKTTKTSKQVHSVVKSFGSLSKTMTKKLKNLGGIKAMNKMEDEENSNNKTNNGNGGTKSSKPVSSVSSELLHDQGLILCAGLRHKRLDYQDEMVLNYLQAARKNFEEDRHKRRAQEDELKQAALKHQQQHDTPVSCINPGCDGIGTASTSYLCQHCYTKQRRQAIDIENNSKSVVDGNNSKSVVDGNNSRSVVDGINSKSIVDGAATYPLPAGQSHHTSDLQRQNTLVNLGTSKFYTYADEDQSLPSSKYTDHTSSNMLRNDSQLNNFNVASRDKVAKAPLELSRSSFYDQPLANVTRVKPIHRKTPPGTAVIINDLRDEQFRQGNYDTTTTVQQTSQPRYQSYDTYTPNSRPPVDLYVPKISNTSAQSGVNAVHQQQTSAQPAPHYVSTVQVGGSYNSIPVIQKCKNGKCSNTALENLDFYCRPCYEYYDRDRTTFL